MSLYDELGVSANATAAEIEKAGKRRVRETHPDSGGNPEAFDRTMRALTVLRDPKRRSKYDRTGSDADEPTELPYAKALQKVTMTMMALFQNPNVNLARIDVVTEARRAIKGEMAKHEQNIRDTERAIKRLEDGVKRVKAKGRKKEDVLRPAINGVIMGYRTGIDGAKAEIEVIDLSLKILDGYEYAVDAPPEPHYPGHTTLTAAALNQIWRTS